MCCQRIGDRYLEGGVEWTDGDTIWEPINDKKGEWKLTTWMDGKILIQKSLFIKEL